MSEDAGTEPEEPEAAGPETESDAPAEDAGAPGDGEQGGPDGGRDERDGEPADPEGGRAEAEGERAAPERTLAGEVAEHDEALAEEVAALEERVAEAEAGAEAAEERADEAEERAADLESGLARTKADFQNYKKRAKKRREEQEERATEDLVSRLTDVRDNLVRALDQDEDADIRPGVASTLETFDRVLAEENVEVIEPNPGDGVDPERHEVLMRVDSDHPEGTVAEVYKPGYEMAGKVIEAAQVTVSDDGE